MRWWTGCGPTTLLRLRKQAGLTQEQVAAHLECSKGKVWQMETGRAAVGTPELRMLFELFAVPEDSQEKLLELARRARSRERVWWQAYDDAIGDAFGRYLDLESLARKVSYFALALVPGLLQTAEYAEALFNGAYPKATAKNLARLRMERQERLLGEQAMRLWAVIDEAALHRKVGGAAVMRGQIDKLIELNELDHVTVQVLPFSAGAHVGQNGAFSILEFTDPGLRATGLSPADSVALMAEARAALTD